MVAFVFVWFVDVNCVVVDFALDADAFLVLKVVDFLEVNFVCIGVFDNRLGERMFGHFFKAGGEFEDLVFCELPIEADDVGDFGLAFGDCAGFVEDDSVNAAKSFE